MKFTQISNVLKYPPRYKGLLSTYHADVITYAMNEFEDNSAYKRKVTDAMNIISYIVVSGEFMPTNWSTKSPFDNLPQDIDETDMKSALKGLFIDIKSVEWDIDKSQESKSKNKCNSDNDIQSSQNTTLSKNLTRSPTNKTDLYIKSPDVPQFDTSHPWFQASDEYNEYVIYKTLPEIPRRQNDISCTTDISKISDNALMELYPTSFIPTRASCMYSRIEGLDFDEQLGVIIPVQGFTKSELLDNLVKYPHIYKLLRQVDSDIVSFYQHIEIDGELHSTMNVWGNLPETENIPRNAEFVKEYVVRRYLLERDVKKIEHKFPIFGTLDPFLTLFMPPEDYIARGYLDVLSIVKQCVTARVAYKQSRNPILRRFK